MITRVKTTLRRLLPTNPFARGVSVLVGGAAGAQLVTVLAAPLLTRLYSPEDFGLVAVYASLLALLRVVSSLRYELAIPLPEDDAEAANVAALSLILVGVSTLLTGALIMQLNRPIAEVLGAPQLASFLWLLPVGVLLGGAYTVFDYWSIRTKRFSAIAATKLWQALATIAIQLTAFTLGGIALLFAQVAGQGVGTTRLGRPALASAGFQQVSWRGILHAARRYRRFPLYTTSAGLINTAGHQLPPLLFAAFFSASAAGLYALAHRLLMLPTSLVGGAIGNVFFSQAAETHRTQKLTTLYASLQDRLIHFGLPPTLTLVIAAPRLFAFIFGEEWRMAGTFAQWLALGVFGSFVVSPLSMIFTVLEKQHIGLMLQANLFGLRLIAILIGALAGSLSLAVALFSVLSFLGYAVYAIVATQYAGVELSRLWGSLEKATLFSLLAVAPLLVSIGYSDSTSFYIGFIATIALIMARYLHISKVAIFI